MRENKSCKRNFSSAPPAAAKPSAASPKSAPHSQKIPKAHPLIFLAPKQATFQLERQLLADTSLNGYTRLHIFSFERLAQFVFEKLNVAPPEFLTDEGRVMVLRALLHAT